ncbi:hypothetical protein MY11210_006617 [Beauveria gryllotalpidicola]
MVSEFQPTRAPIVHLPTPSGHVQTVIGRRSVISEEIEEFRGIPYAQVSRRWEHARLRDQLPRDVFDATKNGPRCPAPEGDTRLFQSYLSFPDVGQDEFECLNLFVVRPSTAALAMHSIDAATARLPVLIWIHGGGFKEGAGTDPVWDPTRLVLRSLRNKTPFIAVSINYRLGIFGFCGSSDIIASQSSDAPFRGVNFGLYDQKLAFMWVKCNIAAFGGDNARITIMGHSSGGISCYLHLLEAELGTKRPLFRKAGVLSGPVGGLDLTSLEKADRRWAKLCRFWSVEADSPADRLDFLRRLPTKDLFGCVAELHWALFTLIVDEWTIRQSNLGCGVSIHLGETSDVPRESDDKVQLLISAADDEFKDFALIANGGYAKFRALLTSSYPSEAAAEEILQACGIFPTLSDEEFTETFSQFVSDSTMMHKVYRGYKFFKAHREQQALLRGQDPKHLGLQYDHFEFGNPFLGPLRGIAHHGIELIYAFGNFHHALEKADQGILQGYADPDQACVEADVGKIPVDMKNGKYQKSNIELSYELQDRWIQFVAQDCSQTGQCTNVDGITTFCPDRSVRMESWSNDEKWAARRKRLEALSRHFDSTTIVIQRLVGSVVGMEL